jgi:hypothetical protein
VINLILSLDYEIFGNGAGDVMRDIIEPTNRLLDICDSHGAKLTIMFEAAEYWAFEQMEDKLDLDYSPAKTMARQAQDAIKRGHDVQLHLHPQWIGAELDDCLWRLRMKQWRFADLSHGLGDKEDEYSITGALSKGKHTLEEIICPVKTTYECIAFRAGGFFVQPSRQVIPAMKAVGMLIDSSVVQGLYIKSPHWHCDFRTAISNHGCWWTTEDDVCLRGPAGKYILEFPVYSRAQPYIINLRWSKVRKVLKRQIIESRYPQAIEQAGGYRSTAKLREVMLKLASVQPVLVDFCKLTARSMVKAMEKILATDNQSGDEIERTIPVVLIGHSKDFWNDEQFNSFLSTFESLSRYKGKIKFGTFSDVAEELIKTTDKHVLNAETERAVPMIIRSTQINNCEVV